MENTARVGVMGGYTCESKNKIVVCVEFRVLGHRAEFSASMASHQSMVL